MSEQGAIAQVVSFPFHGDSCGTGVSGDLGVLDRRQVAERVMGSFSVVLEQPPVGGLSNVVQPYEQMLVQQLIAQGSGVTGSKDWQGFEAAYWWLLKYNGERPHDALGDLTPIEYAQVARNSSSELSP